MSLYDNHSIFFLLSDTQQDGVTRYVNDILCLMKYCAEVLKFWMVFENH